MNNKESEKEEMKDEAHDVEDQEQEEEEEKREEEEEQWAILIPEIRITLAVGGLSSLADLFGSVAKGAGTSCQSNDWQFWDACKYYPNTQKNLPFIGNDNRLINMLWLRFSLQAVKKNSFSVFR